MAPVAYGVLALIAGVMVVAVLVGAAGGVINGRLKGELSLGATLAAGAYVLVVTSLESGSSWKIALFGMLPLILSFLVGSIATRFLETRFGLRPLLASLGALGCALLAGFVYLMPMSFGWWFLADPSTAWLAVAVLLCLVAWSIIRRSGIRSQ